MLWQKLIEQIIGFHRAVMAQDKFKYMCAQRRKAFPRIGAHFARYRYMVIHVTGRAIIAVRVKRLA